MQALDFNYESEAEIATRTRQISKEKRFRNLKKKSENIKINL